MKKILVLLIIVFNSTCFGQYNVFEVCRNGTVEQLNALYKSDLNIINKKNEAGNSPLILATYHGNIKVVSFLVDKVDNINETSDNGTALMAACYKGSEEIVELLLKNGANTSYADDSGTTALHYAVMFNHTNLVKLLVDAGADINTIDKKGQSPLNYAEKSKNEKLLTLLNQG